MIAKVYLQFNLVHLFIGDKFISYLKFKDKSDLEKILIDNKVEKVENIVT